MLGDLENTCFPSCHLRVCYHNAIILFHTRAHTHTHTHTHTPTVPASVSPAWTDHVPGTSHIARHMKISRAFTWSARQQKQLYGSWLHWETESESYPKGPRYGTTGGCVFCPGPLQEQGKATGSTVKRGHWRFRTLGPNDRT